MLLLLLLLPLPSWRRLLLLRLLPEMGPRRAGELGAVRRRRRRMRVLRGAPGTPARGRLLLLLPRGELRRRALRRGATRHPGVRLLPVGSLRRWPPQPVRRALHTIDCHMKTL